MTVMNPQKKNKTVTATKGPVVPPGEFVWPSLARDCFPRRSPDDAASPPMLLSPYISEGVPASSAVGKTGGSPKPPKVPPETEKVPRRGCRGTIQSDIGMYSGGINPPAPPCAKGVSMAGLSEPDNELFLNLVTANYEQLRRYVFTLLPNEEDVKDVLQEVWISISRKFSEYDRSRPFLPWACRFAYLKALKFHEQQRPRRMVRLPTEVLELLAIAREEEEPVLAERLAALERCLDKLGNRDRALIEARYVERTPTDEIATSFSQSRRTMFRNLERVRRLLFDCIDRSVVLGGHA
jgi:RNA polymerase sigma-70 factor (ECF subfamily)